jgi:hypothetical protein
MAHRRILLAAIFSVLVLASFSALRADTGYWKRVGGARFEKGRFDKPSPGRLIGFEASGGEGQVNGTRLWDDIQHPGQAVHRAVGQFTWSFDRPVSTLVPGERITVTGTLSHSGEGSGNAGIAFQPPGMSPGTGHISGIRLLAGFDGTVNRSVSRSAEVVVPDGSRFPEGKTELRFELYIGYSAAVYYAYEWVAAALPPAAKEPAEKEKEEEKPAPPRPSPGKPDLHIDPDTIALTQTTFGVTGWWHSCGSDRDLKILAEPSADQQAITVRIANRSPKFAAKDVQLVVTAQRKGESGRTPGLELAVGDIPPGGKTDIRTHIDLEGENVESATLFFRVFTPGVEDANDDDNEAGVEFSVYYAASEGRGFSAQDDAYSFPNYGWEERAGEELLEGLLTTLVGGLRLDSQALAVMQRLWFASTYLDFAKVAFAGATVGMGGHCYGMAATAALYFEDPGLRPVPKSVPDMTTTEASYNINLYHRAQMLPVFGAIVDQKLIVDLFPSPRRCYENVKASLRDERRALILGFTNDTEYALNVGAPMQGHAVLAYKLVEVSGRNPVIYIYDPNFPEPPFEEGRIMSCGMRGLEINLGLDLCHIKAWYDWASEKHISAFRPHREMPLAATGTRIINALKEVYSKMIEDLDVANEMMAVLRCPADALFTDEKGRRTGILEGRVYQEIPGSKVLSKGDVEICRLPESGRYELDVRGTGKGRLGFDVIRAVGPGEARLVSFNDIPVESKTRLSGALDPEGGLQALAEKDRSYEPSIVGAVKGGKVIGLKTPSKPDQRPAPTAAGSPSSRGGAPAGRGAERYDGVPASRKQVIFSEDFSDNRRKWPVGKIDLGTMDFGIKGGAYILRAVVDQGQLVYRDDIALDETRDFEIEARLRHVAGTENMGHFLFWGRSPDGKNVQFGISGDGCYQVVISRGATYENVIPWTKSELVKRDVPNTLTVRKVGKTYYFFLNGSLVHRMPFRAFDGRQIGFVVAKKATLSVDSLMVFYLD